MSEQSQAQTSEQLTLFAEGSLARMSASQAVALAWVDDGASCGGNSIAFFLCAARNGASLKTSLASCQATEVGTWVPSSGRWGTWGMGGPTGCWTLSGSAWPSSARVCSLSDVLETQPVPQRYYLSRRAAQGILRRAAKRGRDLPEQLRQALEGVAEESAGTT